MDLFPPSLLVDEEKKYQKRHDRPYGCTLPRCAKSFRSKADWKRHETSQHLHLSSWLCSFRDFINNSGCGRIYHREDIYTQHLIQHHDIEKTRFKLEDTLTFTRLDLANQSQFWCGLCRRSIPLQTNGPSALDERFNHIAMEHFEKGELGSDWTFPALEDLFTM
ncbi:hypothetical protein N7528_004014 [Penicillium herquei]|nr:hypothetical protein N7528_004014 [Penicillium herquei]